MMKLDKSVIASFVLLVVIASLYRIMPGRPLGFAPQIAMALFSGSIISNKKYAFLMPLFSMLLSDALYQVLYVMNISPIQGFYGGQIVNYIILLSITVIGFFINKNNWLSIFAGSLAGVMGFYLFSNFAVWIGRGPALNNLPYPLTLQGLSECMAAGIPFIKGSLYATFLFSAVFFGGYRLFKSYFSATIAKA